MTRPPLQRQVAADGDWTDAAQHLLGFVPVIVLLLVARRPLLWAAPVIPLGPLLLGPLVALRSPHRAVTVQHRRAALSAAVTVALGYLLIAGGLTLGTTTPVLGMLIPLFALAIPIVTIAWLTLAGTGAARARRGLLLRYPYIPRPLRLEEGR